MKIFDLLDIVLMIIVVVGALSIIIVKSSTKISPFINDVRYFKEAIRNSYDDDERLYWENELKILYRTYFPFLKYFK